MVRLFGKLYLPFLDPVFLKDLEGLSRRWRMYAGRMIYVGLIGIAVYLFVDELTGIKSPSVSARLGRRLFISLLTLQMGYVTIAMAHMAADLLLREARTGTLQLMLLTPLSGWRIALGKWKAVMAHAATMILSGLPPLAAAAYLGGVGPWDLLWSSSLSFAMAGLSSALSLYAALRARTPARATLAAVAHLLGWGMLVLLVFGVLYALTRSSWVMFAAGILHPVAAAIGAESAAWFGGPTAYSWIGATLLSLAAAQVFLMSAAGHLSISNTVDGLLAPIEAREPDPPAVERLSSNRPVWDHHPLLWRESAALEGGGQGWTRRFAVVLLVAVLVFLLVRADEKPMQLGAGLVPLTGLAMAAGAGLFIRDKEGRHLEVLLTLPVTSGQVVGAKLMSRICTVEGAAYFLSILCLMKFWFDHPPGPCLSLVPPALCFVLFAYLLAGLWSLQVQTSRSAFLLAATVVWGMLLGLPLLRRILPTWVLGIVHPTVLTEGLMEGSDVQGLPITTFVVIYVVLMAAMITVMVRRYRGQIR